MGSLHVTLIACLSVALYDCLPVPKLAASFLVYITPLPVIYELNNYTSTALAIPVPSKSNTDDANPSIYLYIAAPDVLIDPAATPFA